MGNNTIEIGRILKQKRIERGMTQQELAEAIGTDKGNLSKIENGKRNPTAKTLLKITKILGYELKDLLPELKAPQEAITPVLKIYQIKEEGIETQFYDLKALVLQIEIRMPSNRSVYSDFCPFDKFLEREHIIHNGTMFYLYKGAGELIECMCANERDIPQYFTICTRPSDKTEQIMSIQTGTLFTLK